MIGRKNELKIVTRHLQSRTSGLILLTGRLRVGKSFLIRESCKNRIDFSFSGIRDARMTEQLVYFSLELRRQFPGVSELGIPKSWAEAFAQLSLALEETAVGEKRLIFLEELNWLAGKRAGFIEALAAWWEKARRQDVVFLILEGSDVFWMQELHQSAALTGKVDDFVLLEPFTLLEAREFLFSRGIQLSNYQLVLLYMVFGGIPYYLEQIKPDLSAGENIQAICFAKQGALRLEFTRLEASLFDKKGLARKIVEALTGKVHGLTRAELLRELELMDGGWLTELLLRLEASGFLRSIAPLDKRKKDTIFRLGDAFLCFHMHFMHKAHPKSEAQWNPMQQAELYKGWSAYALENVCMAHMLQIRQHMGISGLEARLVSLSDPISDANFDILLDRKDGVLNVVKVFLSADTYAVSEGERRQLEAQNARLVASLRGKREVRWWSLSTYGVKEGAPFFAHHLNIDALLEMLR